ncbi:restriction endonuclease subunit S [Stutzerimonas stutzeri]|uniref:restriction endonuclease subunit S n=1 Tax=Stutzerimonas stutzeri TaxID=316 RepID=UPI003D6CD8A9
MRIDPAIEGKYGRTRLKGGEVLLTLVGSVGQVAVAPKSVSGFNVARAVAVIHPEDHVESEWIALCLRSPLSQHLLGSRANTTVQTTINLKDLRALPIPLPPASERREIASAMLALDDRITLLRETNATLEAIAQALFKSWFVDFDPVRAKAEGRQPEGMDATTAALFPDSFEESELGLVPKGWEVKPVGDVVNVTDYVANGSFAALKENVTLLDQRSYALYVRTTDHNSGFCGGFRYVDKAAYDFLAKSSLLGNEVIISNVGDVGTVFRPPRWLGIPMTLGSNAVALKAPQMSAFLFFHFSGAKGQHDIHSVVTGSAQRKFNKTNFRSLKLLLPTESCLSEFEGKASLLLEAADNNRAKIQTLTQLRDTLLPRLISGQLRLPEAQALLNDRDIA